MYLVPRIAAFLDHDLDALGISVCSVAGTNFTPHVKLLHKLDVPFAVLTDLDEDDEGTNLGEKRVVSLLQHVMPHEQYDGANFRERLDLARAFGLFLGTSTFELDLVRSGRAVSMSYALQSLVGSNAAKARAASWHQAKKVEAADEERFLADIESVGKGRYAQRLASVMRRSRADGPFAQGPRYVVDAIRFLVERCRP